MRRAAAAACAAAMLSLSGCTQSIYNNYRDIESLEVVQAVGIDLTGGNVKLSVATGSDASEREPVRLSAEAESMDAAMRRLEQLAGRGSLFFSGTGAIVLGEAAAGEASRWLDAVARSKELRLDTELFVLRGAEAAGLIAGEDAPEDVFASLNALSVRAREDGPAPVATCADTTRSLIASGAALAAAIALEEGADGKLTPVPAGAAVLTGDGLAGYLDGGAALGAGFFLGGPGMSIIELSGGVTAELAGADIELAPVLSAGALSGLDVRVSLSALVIEAPPGSDLSARDAWAALEDELAELARQWTGEAIGAAAGFGADFLGLGRRLETRWPDLLPDTNEAWAGVLSRLSFNVSAEAKILNMREYTSSPFN